MDGTEDDYLWTDQEDENEEENENEEEIPPCWDTDEKMSQQEWEDLFGLSDDDDSDFDGF